LRKWATRVLINQSIRPDAKIAGSILKKMKDEVKEMQTKMEAEIKKRAEEAVIHIFIQNET